MAVRTYTARFFAFNQIEHHRVRMSNKLSDVTFKSKLDGDKAPAMRSGLSENVCKENKFPVFDQVIKDLEGYWTG